MASMKCMQPQTASAITILQDANGNATEGTSIGAVSRPSSRSFISKVTMHRYSKLEIFLAVVSVLLLVALVVVVVLMEAEKSEDTKADERLRKPEGAIKNLARVLNNMDRKANPCTDFYQYACGGWEKRNYIDDSEVFVLSFMEVGNENKRQLKEILENNEIKLNYSANPAILTAFEMYSSCINTTAVEKFGDSELRTLLVELADFNMTKNRSSSYDWQNFVVKMKRRLDVDAFFKLDVYDDPRNASLRRIIMLAFQLPLHYEYYTAQNFTPEAQRNRERYLQFMTDVMTLVTSGNRKFVKQEMKKVLELETNIAKTQLPLSKRHNISVIYNPVSIENLSNMTEKFDWLSFFRNLTSGLGYVLTPREMLLISSPKMVKDILILLKSTKPSVISNYLAWRIVYGLIEVVPSKYGKLYSAYRGGQMKPKWDTCVQETSNALPLETTFIFAQHALPKDTVNEARSILRDIKDVFIKIIPKQSWMSEKTRRDANEKAKAMIFHLAYPENMASKSLKDAPSKFKVDGSYFTTYQNVKSFMFMEHFKSLKTTKNRNEYLERDPMTPTAFYYRTRNIVGMTVVNNSAPRTHPNDKLRYIPKSGMSHDQTRTGSRRSRCLGGVAEVRPCETGISVGFLQTKLFSLENYKSANFGALGMVVGHEISHGYDSIGSKFDKNGDQRKWVSSSSSKNILKKHLCLTKSYSNLTYSNRKLGSVGDYRQQYCDIGGLTLAFEAYKEWKNHHSEEEILPALDITHNKLFFLSYAQMWCAKYKNFEVTRMTNAGSYPLSLRAQGTVMNSQEFADAFSCARGTAMNPKEKCKVWET